MFRQPDKTRITGFGTREILKLSALISLVITVFSILYLCWILFPFDNPFSMTIITQGIIMNFICYFLYGAIAVLCHMYARMQWPNVHYYWSQVGYTTAVLMFCLVLLSIPKTILVEIDDLFTIIPAIKSLGSFTEHLLISVIVCATLPYGYRVVLKKKH